MKRGNIKRNIKAGTIAKPTGRAPKEIGAIKLRREIPRPNKAAPAYWEIQLQWRDRAYEMSERSDNLS